MLFPSQTSIGDLKLRLMERLVLVEIVPVCSAEHVSVKILLRLPGAAVPFLAIASVTASQ